MIISIQLIINIQPGQLKIDKGLRLICQGNFYCGSKASGKKVSEPIFIICYQNRQFWTKSSKIWTILKLRYGNFVSFN